MTTFRTVGTLLALAVCTRWLVGRFPHSGQSKPPMYGDYEAQRHWMEITTNLPPSEWYKNSTDNDLQYWGLDYPPLTAFHMQALGLISQHINSSWTELHTSRGEESHDHKIFMRYTVLMSDFLIYMTGVVYFFLRVEQLEATPGNQLTPIVPNKSLFLALALMYPGQILIDHGHFHYNCVFLGLVVWAVILMSKGMLWTASSIYSLALCYKQMSLYYALPFFWFIFAFSIRLRPLRKGVFKIFRIGVNVLFILLICCRPFISSMDDITQLINRLFPFNRGIYEDKVANVWFSLSILIKLRQMYPVEELVKLSLFSTLLASLPSGLHLLFRPTIRNFRYSLVNTSLAFFLLSFQVHEKSILIPALPILLLYREHPLAVNWFALVSTFSLHPLLVKDEQKIPYFCLLMSYSIFSSHALKSFTLPDTNKLISSKNIIIFIYLISTNICILASILGITIAPPNLYPDAYAVLNALYSCIHFLGFLMFFNYQQLKGSPTADRAPKSLQGSKKLLKKKVK